MSSKKEPHKIWMERINRAIAVRNDWSDLMKVEMGRDYFEGKQNPGWPEHEWITVNKIYAHLQAQLPALYSLDPYFYVKLKKTYTPDPNLVTLYEQRGKIRQANLNYLKGELKLKEKARLGIQDAHFAYGVVKTRFSAKEIENPKAGEPIKDEEGNEIKDEETGEVLTQPDTLLESKKYIISRVHPDDFGWDEDAQELQETWKFTWERIKMTREEAENDPRFTRKVIDSIQGQKPATEKKSIMSKASSLFNKATEEEDEHQDIIVMYEVYDLVRREWLIVAEGADDFLKEPEGLPPGVEDHPYSVLRFTLRDKSPYPIPPVSQGLGPQKEFNLSRSRILRHRKRFNRRYEVLAQALVDDSELSKLESDDDGVFIKVQQHGAVNPIKDAPLDQQTYTEIALLNNDLTEIFGSPDSARGIASADSATEASLLDKRLEVREGDRLSMVVDFVTDIARKLDQLAQAHLDKEEAVKITGPEGEFWQKITPDDYEKIDGEFEYTVNVGASQPRLPDIERAQWTAFMSQVVIPMPHILTAPTFLKRMAEMYHIDDEAALKELMELGKKILAGVYPQPGNTGSQPSEGNAAAAIMGQAMGALGGNNNGGGSQV